MPYRTIEDLPKAQTDQYNDHQKKAFREAFNSAYEKYAFRPAFPAFRRVGISRPAARP